MNVLCGDIGGTSTRLALVAWDDARPRVLKQNKYKSEDFASLDDAIDAFVSDAFVGDAAKSNAFDAAGFGVAGPVHGGRVEATNLPWVVDAQHLASRLGLASVSLVNDLAALAHGAPFVRAGWNTLQVRGGEAHNTSSLFVGAGTGFGVAYEAGGEVHASEGGHVGFAPRDEDEVQLWRRATERFGRASAERIVSGGGLPLIFEHYAERCATPTALRADVVARGGEAISEAAARGDEAACETLDKFVSLFGSACGDLALVFRPQALLLAGGLTLKLMGAMPNFAPLFLSAFHDKGRMRPLNERTGVHVVADESAALFGAAASAMRLAMSGSR